MTINEANIVAHRTDDKEFSPPFIKVGKRFVLRSIKGCLRSSVYFLQSELKSRYPKDYFKWINERESFFRKQLYDLFDSERVVRIERNIEINSNKIRTDIDAVLFDKKTKSLGLFQLKWQDKYSSDLVARRSRISNFYPKAIEWVDKMDNWVSLNNSKEI